MSKRPCLTLSVTTECDGSRITMVAQWQKIYGIWSCVSATTNLQWMVGMNQDQAKLHLLKMGADYQWHRHCIPQQTDIDNNPELTGNRNDNVALARPEEIASPEGRNEVSNQNAPAPILGPQSSSPEGSTGQSENAPSLCNSSNAQSIPSPLQQ